MTRKMETKRTFIGIEISQAARKVCENHIDFLRTKFRDVRVRWERLEKLHITLKFLGATDVNILPRLEDRIAAVADKYPSFTLQLAGAGVFPSKSQPRSLWIGFEGETGSVIRLYHAVESVCDALGFAREKRDFRPHLTIGRVGEPLRAAALAREHMRASIEPIGIKVANITLYESSLQPGGSAYSELFRVKLGPR